MLRERATDPQPRGQYALPWRPSYKIIDGKLFPVPAKAQRDDHRLHSDDTHRCLRAPPAPSRRHAPRLGGSPASRASILNNQREAPLRTPLLSRTAHRRMLCGRRFMMSRPTPSRLSPAILTQPKNTLSVSVQILTDDDASEHGLRRKRKGTSRCRKQMKPRDHVESALYDHRRAARACRPSLTPRRCTPASTSTATEDA